MYRAARSVSAKFQDNQDANIKLNIIWAILKTFSHSLCRIILGMPKLTLCLCAWVLSLRGANWGSPYAKSLRGLMQVWVLFTPNTLWQGPYKNIKVFFRSAHVKTVTSYQYHNHPRMTFLWRLPTLEKLSEVRISMVNSQYCSNLYIHPMSKKMRQLRTKSKTCEKILFIDWSDWSI